MRRVTPEQMLIGWYRKTQAELTAQITADLHSGRLFTASYRHAQLARIQGQLNKLTRRTATIAQQVALEPYQRGARATAVSLQATGVIKQSVSLESGGLNAPAARILAYNLTGKLNAGIVRVGRQTSDMYRTIGNEQVAKGLIGASTRREVSSAITRELIEQKVTDATTGFVDRRGTRWGLDRYSEMLARTTTREAVSAATVETMTKAGETGITISSHSPTCPICEPYDGETYALPGTGEFEGHPEIDELPPFHPNCEHVAVPALGNAERFLEQLSETVWTPPAASS